MNALLAFWKHGLLVALLAALGVWHYADRAKAVSAAVSVVRAEYTAEALAFSEAARRKEIELNLSVERAKNEADIREKKLVADSVRSAAVVGGLRDEISSIRASLPGLTRAAVDRYADTASVVLEQCVNEYRSLAQVADGLASDRQTLIDAWPR